MPKHVDLTEPVLDYIDRHRFDRDDPVLAELIEVTRQRTGKSAGMQISPEQGAFMSILVAACGARLAVEVGTFTGYSSICIARALPPGGRLHCFDISEEFTSVARQYWPKAGVADRITLHLGPAVEMLAQHLPDEPIDFAFIDADKAGYDAYYEALLPRMRRGPSGGGGALIVFDNMLRHGQIADPNATGDTAALRALNDKLAADPRVQSVLVPIADGLTICRVR